MFVLFSPGVCDLLLQRVTRTRNLLLEYPPAGFNLLFQEQAGRGNLQVKQPVADLVARPHPGPGG
jgi:hypothetical protein